MILALRTVARALPLLALALGGLGLLVVHWGKAAENAVYVAPNGSDRGFCTAKNPCKSLDRAYHVARTGAVVKVAGGTYPEQTLRYDGTKGPGVIPFRPLHGARVRMAGLKCGRYSNDRGPDRIELSDMTLGYVSINICHDVTLRDADLADLILEGSTRFRMYGGDIGPANDIHPDIQPVYRDKSIIPRDALFDGVDFHGFHATHEGAHEECLQVTSVDGLVIRNSRFHDCDTFDLHVTNEGVRNILIENNVFEASGDHTGSLTPYYSLSVRGGDNVVIRRNAADQVFALPAKNDRIGTIRVEHNIAPLNDWQCDARLHFVGNQWSKARCSPKDLPAKRVGTEVIHRSPGGSVGPDHRPYRIGRDD